MSSDDCQSLPSMNIYQIYRLKQYRYLSLYIQLPSASSQFNKFFHVECDFHRLPMELKLTRTTSISSPLRITKREQRGLEEAVTSSARFIFYAEFESGFYGTIRWKKVHDFSAEKYRFLSRKSCRPNAPASSVAPATNGIARPKPAKQPRNESFLERAVPLKFESADLMAAVASHHVHPGGEEGRRDGRTEGWGGENGPERRPPLRGHETENGNHEHAKGPVSCCEH
ncbi:uncharacterized protein LOC143152309 [Ptiloglossa arizonensis]|uniref:uncharacterized protein LOC143152309 n=1 Tax=Ptiloglossa arizonensis TaxID=3350558 RepID=UPI003F9F3A00